jgi:hypothetical protein
MYGSVVNRIMESGRYPEITVGMGATITFWSDRSSATVIAVRYAKDGKTVREIDTRGDDVGPNKVTWPAQDYDITPAPSLEQDRTPNWQTWRMDQRGRLRKTMINDNGRRVMCAPNNGPGIILGSRDYYQDPSF